MIKPFHHSCGKASMSKTWATLVNLIVLAKYALSGLTLGTMTFGAFDGVAAAAIVAAFNGAYIAREYQEMALKPAAKGDEA